MRGAGIVQLPDLFLAARSLSPLDILARRGHLGLSELLVNSC